MKEIEAKAKVLKKIFSNNIESVEIKKTLDVIAFDENGQRFHNRLKTVFYYGNLTEDENKNQLLKDLCRV